MSGICSTAPVLLEQLHGFQAVIDLHEVATAKDFGQIAGQSQSGHLRAVAVGDRWFPTPVRPCADPRLARADSRKRCPRLTPVSSRHTRGTSSLPGGIWGSSQQVVDPFTLLFRAQGTEEVRCFFGAPQFCDAV